jgi:long-chain fatty acid adenylyltransferase FadD28
MQVIESSISAVLRERAHLAPSAAAFTFMNYDQDSAGVAESLTWSEVYRRALGVAQELQRCGPAGSRAVVLAPQGLDYVVAFLGALQAGFIAIPLSLLDVFANDGHIRSVLHDASPSAILTTSSIVGSVAAFAQPQDGSAPWVIEVDALDPVSSANLPATDHSATAYLQYTSGSTRQPTGVRVSHRNLQANFEQVMANYFDDTGNVAQPETTVVSWVPLSHNMGLFIGVCAPILSGLHTVFMSPLAFLQRPARWMQLLASHSQSFSPAPNFALDLAVQMTSDEDMAELDLGDVRAIIAGGERIQPASVRRFNERFAYFNLRNTVVRPSYGLAEATVYVATRETGHPAETVRFDPAELAAGRAKRSRSASGTALFSYGVPREPVVRIVDPDTRAECVTGTVGEIWVHGDNVAEGYWQKPDETEQTFGARLVAPSAGTPEAPWLRTGDLGAISDGELFIMGRIKDVVIIYGRNHYPDDIEATIRQITGGRVAAISVQDDGAEKLVAIIEFAVADPSAEDALDAVKREVTSALSEAHGLGAADLVLVSPGSIPCTSSGKVRRSACAERYRRNEFTRLVAHA